MDLKIQQPTNVLQQPVPQVQETKKEEPKTDAPMIEEKKEIEHTGKWGVYLIRNKGKINRKRMFNSMAEANQYAKEFISEFDSRQMEVYETVDEPNKPYSCSTCVNDNAAYVMIWVEEIGKRELDEHQTTFPKSIDFGKEEDVHYQKNKKLPKGSTISEKNAIKEYDLTEEEIHEAYKNGDIVPMRACMMGNYYNKIEISQLLRYISKLRMQSVDVIKKDEHKSQAEVRRIKKDIADKKEDIENKKRQIIHIQKDIELVGKEIENLYSKESRILDKPVTKLKKEENKPEKKKGRGRPRKKRKDSSEEEDEE